MRGSVVAAACLVPAMSLAAPPDNSDHALAPWYNNLRAPWTNALCCSIADCRPTEARIRGDDYEVFVGGTWQLVPPDKVLQRSDNPTGHAVVCWTPTAGILCFVRGPDS
jgi:hypothetical protein